MTSAGILETLELLNDVDLTLGAFVTKVEERIEHQGSLLTRHTRLHVQIPQVPRIAGLASNIPFVYVLRSPRRGQLWSLDNLEVSCDSHYRLLGHEEHVLHSQHLIAVRFWSVCALGSLKTFLPVAG